MGSIVVSAPDFCRRNVIEYKVDPALVALVHHAVLFLVIDFIDVADRHSLGTAVDHETHSGIGINRNVNAMSVME